MKTRTWMGSKLMLALAGFVLTLGCASDTEKGIASDGANGMASAQAASPVPEPPADQPPTRKIAPEAVATSPGVEEIVKLAQANVEEGVILAYIENSNIPYDPGVEEILYLNDIGISSKIVTAMMRRGRVLQQNGVQGKAVEANQKTKPLIEPLPTTGTNLPPEMLAGQPLITNSAPPVASTVKPAPALMGAAPPSATATPNTGVTYELPTQPVTVNYFYDSLAPYGSWMEIPDYGWAWQPSVANIMPEWRPYADHGRWLNTDNGWYWQSDYSWGWAPFHYGRWLYHGQCGWVWFPDTVWGPSWVCWRRTPMYCGWAPLPPAAGYEIGRGFTYYGVGVGSDCDFGLSAGFFTFISYRNFNDRHPYDYYQPGSQVNTLFNQSTVVNHYFLGPNRTIINEGIGTRQITAFSRSELRKVPIRDMPAAPGKVIKPDRFERQGGLTVIYRPNLQTTPPMPPAFASAQGPAGLAGGPRSPGSSPAISASNHRQGQGGPFGQSLESRPASSVAGEVTHTTVGGVPVTRINAASSVAHPNNQVPLPISPVLAYKSLYPNVEREAVVNNSAQNSTAALTTSPPVKPSASAPPPKVIDTRPNTWQSWPAAASPSAPTPSSAASTVASPSSSRSEIPKPANSISGTGNRAPWQPGISQPGWGAYSPDSTLSLPNRNRTTPSSPTPPPTPPARGSYYSGTQTYRQEAVKPDPGSYPSASFPASSGYRMPGNTTAEPAAPRPAYRAPVNVPSYPVYQTPAFTPPAVSRSFTPSAPVQNRISPPASFRSMDSAPVRSAPPPSVSAPMRSMDAGPSRAASAPASRTDPSRDKK